MAGDWNNVLDTFKEYQNYKHVNNPKAREVVESVITDLNLCDIWRDLNPDCHVTHGREQLHFNRLDLTFFLLLIQLSLLPRILISTADIGLIF